MRLGKRARALLGACAAALAVGVVGAQPASATPLPPMSGPVESHLAALINSDITFDGTFQGDVDLATSRVTGTFATSPGELSFSALGIIPVTTGVELEFTEPVTGTVDLTDLTVDVTATFNIRLTSMTFFGIPVLDAAQTCQTVSTVSTNLTGTFDPATGIVMTGEYAIPNFEGCGFFQDWINLFTVGSGNTINTNLAI
jgi:hypothetical protein